MTGVRQDSNDSPLRQHLAVLREKGLLVEIDEEVHPVYGIGHHLAEHDLQKAVLFTKVKGSTHSLLANVACSRSLLALSMGVDISQLHLRLQDAVDARLPPELVNEAPFLANQMDADLHQLPIPKFYKGDAGLYLTASNVFALDPSGNGDNSSIHRMLVKGSTHGTIRIVPRDLFTYHAKARELGEDLPIAIVVGTHPSISLASSTPLPLNQSEMHVANHLLDGKLTITPTPKYGIPVPSHAEFVIEGKIKTEETGTEGSFVDISGTLDEIRQQPVFEVERMYHRDDAMFQTILPAGNEHFLLMGFAKEVKIREFVLNTVPSVRGVNLTPGGNAWLHAVVSVKKQKDGDGKNAIFAAFAAHPSLKWVTVVDDDIDPYDPHMVEWATITRTGEDDVIVVRRARGSSLDTAGDQQKLHTQKVGIDATRSLGKPAELFLKAMMPTPDDLDDDSTPEHLK